MVLILWCKCIVETEEKCQDGKLKVINNVRNMKGRWGQSLDAFSVSC